ncbi:MAG: DUF1501 domain-containing protein [Planctomycetes bacterium]|nr:DUF1501 domain-containing protein [Planctomycetota bacterium]
MVLFDHRSKCRPIPTSKLLDQYLVDGQQQSRGPKKAGEESGGVLQCRKWYDDNRSKCNCGFDLRVGCDDVDSPDNIRGEFAPIATRTPGVLISEHLPMLATRCDKWATVRSLSHPYIEHSFGHHVMVTGRTGQPVGFDLSRDRLRLENRKSQVGNRYPR